MEDDKSHQFLMGLDDDLYSNIRGQILALDPVPPLDKIFKMVRQEENHKRMMWNWESRDNAALFAITHHGRNNNHAPSVQPPQERVSYTHCGKPGHEQSNCYELIGYLAGWGTRGRGRGRGTRGGRSAIDGTRGETAYAVATKTGSSSTMAEAIQSPVPDFTAEQVQR